jgi:hypothetical protein
MRFEIASYKQEQMAKRSMRPASADFASFKRS